jgi:uncharacterized protein YbjT (DUF2867 family)
MTVSLESAAVVGATGLVGRELLRLLLADATCMRVTVLGRRHTGEVSPKLTEVTVDLADGESYRQHLAVDAVFCALGTTIKKAGSEAAFRRVDQEYPLAVAGAAADAGGKRFVIVTAVGADAASSVFYNRVKGELEQSLRRLKLSRGLRILHPSLLLGDRAESRPAERVASALMRATGPLFGGGLMKYRAIEATAVARAMLTAARSDGAGEVVYEGASLFAAAQQPQA